MGEQGRESVVEKFAPETMVATIESVYNHLLYGSALQEPQGPEAQRVSDTD